MVQKSRKPSESKSEDEKCEIEKPDKLFWKILSLNFSHTYFKQNLYELRRREELEKQQHV